MAAKLPLEVVSSIAQFVSQAEYRQGTRKFKVHTSLVPFSLVNTVWQAAFEAVIYAELHVRSPSETQGVIVGREAPRPKYGITLERLEAITTGPEEWKITRRKALRRIVYRVAVPHWLAWESKGKDDDFSYDNRYRRENNEAFEVGMRSLFSFLPRWSSDLRFKLSVTLQAENVYTSDQEIEPDTIILGEESFTAYVADLHPDCGLSFVDCISELECVRSGCPAYMGRQNGISTRAAVIMSQSCAGGALKELHLDDQSSIPASEYRHAIEYRQATAENLFRIPKSVRVLHISWNDRSPTGFLPGHDFVSDDPWNEDGHPLVDPSKVDVLPDTFSAALRDVAEQLDELHVKGLAITPEFFRLGSSDARSGAKWSHLKTLNLKLPLALPNGEPLCYNFHLPEHDDYGERIRTSQSPPSDGVWRLPSWRNEHLFESVIFSYFDLLFGAVGEATAHMPSIENLTVKYRAYQATHELKLFMRDGRRVLKFYSDFGYSPSMSVLEAWKLAPEDVILDYETVETEYTTWPPRDRH